MDSRRGPRHFDWRGNLNDWSAARLLDGYEHFSGLNVRI